MDPVDTKTDVSHDVILAFQEHGFHLKPHLQSFLRLDPEELNRRLESGQSLLAEMGRRDFDWQQATEFYQDRVGEVYILELAAWHLSSQGYIADTLRLVAQQARGILLDFGGGIGTHALAAAYSPSVEQVLFWDLNPLHRDLVAYRAQRLGLSDKITCLPTLPEDLQIDTILCFDVLEHLPDPGEHLRLFHQWLKPEGRMILNWYFFKGFQQEYPFHLEDPLKVEHFFRILQTHFLEIFHPFLITTRCYRKDR
jgi:2-polyprenyl-3-methyl-5-hydroxy-6-metoxy-1,4-benzoquinol methylase